MHHALKTWCIVSSSVRFAIETASTQISNAQYFKELANLHNNRFFCASITQNFSLFAKRAVHPHEKEPTLPNSRAGFKSHTLPVSYKETAGLRVTRLNCLSKQILVNYTSNLSK